MISFPKIFSLNILHIEHSFVEIHDFGDLVVRERCNNTPSFQLTISCQLEIPVALRGAPWLPVSQQEFAIIPRFYPACPIFLYDNSVIIEKHASAAWNITLSVILKLVLYLYHG